MRNRRDQSMGFIFSDNIEDWHGMQSHTLVNRPKKHNGGNKAYHRKHDSFKKDPPEEQK